MKDTTFSVREGEHQVCVSGKVLPHTWPSKATALAGLATEQRRLAKQTCPQVPFDLLTKDSSKFLLWSCEASDLGWAPGVWPTTIWMVSASGHGAEYDCVNVELDGTHVYRPLTGNTTVRIFND